ncbi:MAG: zinc-binding dehydrogenase, partial [Dehalococcoidia bacterium]
LDSVGEAPWRESLRSVRVGGCVVVPGATAGANPPADLNRVYWRQISIIGSSMGSLAEMYALVQLVEATGLRPLLDETFPLVETRAAMARMAAGQHVGKIIVEVG